MNQLYRLLRWILLVLVIINMIPMLNSGSIHRLCPYGGLETLYRINFKSVSQLLLVITIVITILFRRSFCGLICPLGAVQEFMAKFQKNKWVMPKPLDRYFRLLKYLVLLVTLVGSWKTLSYWWIGFDPYYAYAMIVKNISGMSPQYFFGFLVLLISFLGSFLFDRFLCKYICPLGAFYGIVGYFSPTRVVRNQKTCIHCNLCTQICPVNIDVAREIEVISPECISCNECVNVCPKEGAIELKFWRFGLSVVVVLVLTYLLFFGGVYIIR
jgi:polyferredoxin